MERLKDPMITPTAQYAGTMQENQNAFAPAGSANRLPIQPLAVPMDLVPSDGPPGHQEKSSSRSRVSGNPDPPAGAWLGGTHDPGQPDSMADDLPGGPSPWVSTDDMPDAGVWTRIK